MNMTPKVFLYSIVLSSAVLFSGVVAYAGTLVCTARISTCSGAEVEIFEMQNTSNAHSGLSAASYTNLICCTGVTGLSNLCSGTFATALKLSGATNAHIRQGTLADYPSATNACISVPSGATVSVGYQATNCTTPILYDTMIGSMVGTTNSHVGNSGWTAGTTKICATAADPSPVYSISITSSGVISYGYVALGVATSTVSHGYTQTALNDGNATEKLNVKSSDATGGTSWTLASSIGTNIFTHEFSTTTGSRWDVMPDSATYVTANPSVAISGTTSFDFRLTTPSSLTDFSQKSITITVQAVAP